PSFLKEKMKYFDIVHFAGHADYVKENPERSGWRLSKASLTAQDIIKMAGSATIPTLIFSNACQSARTEEWALAEQYQNEIFGLANAFLLAGVKHYVGTFWEILDEPSRRFALEFYKQLLSGMTTGEAMREARRSLIKEYGEESIVWASYLLYGDPTSNYMDQINLAETEEEEQELVGVATSDASVRSLEVERSLTEEKVGKGFRIWWAVAAGMGISLLILILFMVMQQGREKPKPQNLALSPGSMISQTIPDSDLQKTVQIIHLLSSYQDQLNDRLKEGGFFKKGKQSDPWTSTPINVCMISPNWEKLDPDSTESLKPPFERIFKRMTEAFTQTKSLGMSILERERLAVLLQELNIGIPNLSTDSLKDAYTILSAQVILFPEPLSYQLNQELGSEVSLRMVETKSTKIISAFSSAFSPQMESIDDTASQLVRKTVRTLETEYPLQGRIMSLDGQTVEINLGSSVGITQDQSFSVLGKTDKELPKGTIQIRSIYERTALAKILDEEKAFKTGDRIRAIPIRVSGTGQ
ncbi:MAG: CHAT domain-containing protein, partial [bacterium]